MTISSTNFIISMRFVYLTQNINNYYELMKYPGSLLTSDYVFSRYNNYIFSLNSKLACRSKTLHIKKQNGQLKVACFVFPF